VQSSSEIITTYKPTSSFYRLDALACCAIKSQSTEGNKNSRINTKTIFCLLYAYHLFTLLAFKVFTIHFNTRCQLVTPLLYCKCMMLWSDCEYIIYNVGNVSVTKQTECLSLQLNLGKQLFLS